MTPPYFSLVLPCFNEAPSLKKLAERAVACATRRGLSSEQFQLILVDNGSNDATPDVLAKLQASAIGGYVRPVKVATNRGYGHGILSGLKAAKSEWSGWTHADEQCDPEDAFLAWEKAKKSSVPVLVKGRRVGRAFGQWLFSRAFELVGCLILQRKFHEINAQPKVFSQDLMVTLENAPVDFSFDLFVLLQAREHGYRIDEIEVRFPDRVHGQSRWAATWPSKIRTIARLVRFMVRYRLRLSQKK